MAATEPLKIDPSEGPFLTHGAGAWIVGDKAKKTLETMPDRGLVCALKTDEALVVLEDRDCRGVSTKLMCDVCVSLFTF